jgi:membrane protease subunit (stomatin/prohibitin family)
MALLLKAIEWVDNSQDTMVYRYPMEGREINFGSKLTVRESQVAVFVVKGKIADVFGPGIHTLAVANLPIVSKLLALPFGFKQPFTAEIYYVNTKQFANQKWGTANPITMRDAEFGVVRIRAYGKYSFRVNDATVFLKELFGTNSSFKTSDINDYLRSMLIAGISDTIAESKISAIDLACNLLEFNKKATEQIAGSFTNLGLALANIVVENISFPEAVEKAIDTRSSMGVMNDKMDTFVKYQAANAMREGVNNPNGMGGLGVQLGTGAAVGQMMSEALRPQPAQAPAQAAPAAKTCVKCGAHLAPNAKFCGECGAKQEVAALVCPQCGEKRGPNSKFCGNCGHKF